jgi:hypothetical protein
MGRLRGKLKSSSVTAKKLKSGSVTGARVLDGSLTGADIKASTLGTVLRPGPRNRRRFYSVWAASAAARRTGRATARRFGPREALPELPQGQGRGVIGRSGGKRRASTHAGAALGTERPRKSAQA